MPGPNGAPRDPDGQDPGRNLLGADPDPWPEPVDGTALLDELAHTYRRFVSLPDSGAEALALWIVFTYALEAFDVAPILALCSPLSGVRQKTTTEEVTTALARRPLAAANVTAAGLSFAITSSDSVGERSRLA